MKNNIFAIAIGVVLFFLGAFYVLSKNFKSENQIVSQRVEPSINNNPFRVVPFEPNLLIKPHSPTKGTIKSKVTIVEFLDPECEACSAMYPVVKKILQEHEGDLKLVVRYMTYHQNSKFVANILEGARAQKKYWETLELLFETQDRWANHQNPKPELIPEILGPLKLDINRILADAKAGKYDRQIMEDFEDGKKVGVNGTPTFFVNGQLVEEIGYDPLKKAIVEKLVH